MKVTDYQFGRITIDDKVYTQDVIISPNTVKSSWWRKEGHRLHIEDLGDIEKAHPDLLVVGTGFYGRMVVPETTRQYLEAKGIKVHAVRTTDAVKRFNELKKDYARIVAALHLTC